MQSVEFRELKEYIYLGQMVNMCRGPDAEIL